MKLVQVLSAKVVAKAQSKARFGYVTLATREQAQKCISELNGTELKGNTIHVELVSENRCVQEGGPLYSEPEKSTFIFCT